MYAGIFWIRDLDDLSKSIVFKIKDGLPIDDRCPLNSKNLNNYTHKETWKYFCSNKPYDYYPRGRVEKDGIVYLNPVLNRTDIIDYLKNEFELDDVLIREDCSTHYKNKKYGN